MFKIAVDFDGTIVEHAYPDIGEPKLFAFETLKELQKRNCNLILWTFRVGQELENAVEFCKKNGVEFYAINKNYPEEQMSEDISRKIDADIYIDDKNIGGFPGWSEIWQMLAPLLGADENSDFIAYKNPRDFWIKKIFTKKKPKE